MAASNKPITGINFLLKAGGTTVGGRRGATLNMGADSIDISTADDNAWRHTLQGLKDWGVDFDGLFYEGATPAATDGHGGKIEVSADGGTTWQELEEMRGLSLELAMDTIDRSSHQTAKHTAILPSTRSWTMNASGLYLDPAGTGGAAQKLVWDAYDSGNELQVRLAFGDEGSTYTGASRVTSAPLSAPYDDMAGVDFTFESNDALTQAIANADTGLDELLTHFFAADPAPLTVLFTTDVTGSTEWTGNAFLTSATLTVPHDGPVDISGTLTGDEALTRQIKQAA